MVRVKIVGEGFQGAMINVHTFKRLWCDVVSMGFGSSLTLHPNKLGTSLRFLVIGWLQNRCGDVLFLVIFFLSFLPTSEICDTWMYMQLLEPDQISHTQSMVAKLPSSKG